MAWPRSRTWNLVALLFVALVALAGHETGAWRSPPAFPPESSGARITIDPGGLVETLLPARPDPDNGSWVRRSPHFDRHNADVAVLGALTAVFMVGYATRSARWRGVPSIRPVGRGAVVRGPPVLRTA